VTVALIDRYRDRLPVSDRTPVISLGEGSTPLLRAARLSERLGVELWLKWEASNPTGSYKDRGMTVAVSKAVEDGAEAVICASTGNTAASAAAYAARAGIAAVVLTPEGAVAGAKVAQTRMLGATVLEVRGDFDEALGAAQELARRGTHVLVNSVNPNRREGQKTAVFEVVEELGGPPDAFVIPYGGGGNTSAYAAGIRELGLTTPIFSVEAEHRSTTLASAIRIGDPIHAESVHASGATIVTVSDEEIVAAWRELAAVEGLFCEPSSAAGLAAVRRNTVPGERLVLTITGHGLKDTENADRYGPALEQVDADPEAIAAAAQRGHGVKSHGVRAPIPQASR
jgi:threonine synthase